MLANLTSLPEQFYADEYTGKGQALDYVKIYGQGFSPTYPQSSTNLEVPKKRREWRRKRFQELDSSYSPSPLAEGEHFTDLQTDYKHLRD